MDKKGKITGASRLMLAVAGIALIASLTVPIWSIELDAPQYPEGLNLKIHAHKIGGNVDIVNGLNHYIGMKTLHTEDFIEFTILPYIIGTFALFAFLAAAIGKRKLLNVLFVAFLLFGIVSMVDFWRWEYDYGHDLNPDAAIIVPGMAYQPPLIGFKQLLNFGAYSMPDTGGWLFLAAGILMLLALVLEIRKSRALRLSGGQVSVAGALCLLMLNACENKPKPVKLNADNCHFCEMTIADLRFAAEFITNKGRAYKFDDISCMVQYMKENSHQKYKGIYISDYLAPNLLTDIHTVALIEGESVGSPMGGNIAAFSNKDSAAAFQQRMGAKPVSWEEIKQ